MIFDKTRTRLLLLGFLLISGGLALRQILTAYHGDYSSAEVTVYTVFALLLAVAGIVLIVRHFLTRRAHEMDFEEDYYTTDRQAESSFAGLANHFRKDLSEFYTEEESGENVPVQGDCTQLFRNILELRKQRLDRLGVRMTWRSAPRAYTDQPWREHTRFDGKYEVTEIDQEIEACRKFTAEGDGEHTVLLRHDRELAHYTVINAHRVTSGEDMISSGGILSSAERTVESVGNLSSSAERTTESVGNLSSSAERTAESAGEMYVCPNCGARTTRENLLDGCDYCGTRFTVEDLGAKISDFTLRDDADLAFAKFKDKRLDRGYIAFWIFALIGFIFWYLCMMIVLADESGASGDPTNPLLLTVGLVGVSAAFAYLAGLVLMAGYLFVIFPLTEICGHRQHRSKKQAESLRNHEKEENALAERIREYDPQFSLSGFRSDIQNKLTTILYAETAAQVYAFTAGAAPEFPGTDIQESEPEFPSTDIQESKPEFPGTGTQGAAPADSAFHVPDLSGCLSRYNHVIDTDLLEMNLQDVHRDASLQSIDLRICLRLHELTPGSSRASSREEIVRMRVSRPSALRTQAVCAPYVLTCAHCGDSLSLTDGLICRSCGAKADLSQYGWVITGFEV